MTKKNIYSTIHLNNYNMHIKVSKNIVFIWLHLCFKVSFNFVIMAGIF